jgi:hypothetical protein
MLCQRGIERPRFEFGTIEEGIDWVEVCEEGYARLVMGTVRSQDFLEQPLNSPSILAFASTGVMATF